MHIAADGPCRTYTECCRSVQGTAETPQRMAAPEGIRLATVGVRGKNPLSEKNRPTLADSSYFGGADILERGR